MHKFSAQHLVKRFEEKTILNGISFSAHAGQILALLGESGCGKTTLLRCLSQLETPSSGTVIFDGHALTYPKKANSHSIGLVFQQHHLFAHLSVLDNLTIAPRYVLKQERKKVLEQANLLLEQLGIGNKGKQYPKELSGGEQQRVAIARALMMQPDVLLFDEPTSALDPKRSQDIALILRSLADKGMTILLASHDLPFVKAVANEVLFLENGKIIEHVAIADEKINATTNAFTQFLEAA